MTKIGCAVQERAEMLETTQWAHEFTWPEIENIAKYLYIAKAAKGSAIFAEGARDAEMYLIVAGSVTVFKDDVTNREKVLSVITKGKVIGEMALFDGQPRSAKVIANDDATMLVLSRGNLDRLINDIPKLAVKLLLKLGALMSQRLRLTSGVLVDYI
jgi:CRP/FNR family transcriptional regulator, cyclic AMP receptor protein